MSNQTHFVILIPIFDDWNAFQLLVNQIDVEFVKTGWLIEILAIDDGSEVSFEQTNLQFENLNNIVKVSVLKLRRNVGHQRAIATGLTFIEEKIECDAVLVMDGDGEDTPSEAKRLIEKCVSENFDRLIFARRKKRSEGVVFRFLYSIYKTFYRILTGKQFRFGNFSVIPRKFLSRLSVMSEGWNHYAAGVLKARIPYYELDTVRGTRLSGQSKMNFVSLIIHGLSSVSVYSEVVGVRLLVATFFLTVISGFLIGVVVVIRLLTNLAIPGWATYAIAFLILILLQAVTLSLFFSFIVLNGRDTATFIPQRDYHYFIADQYQIYPNN
jgi:glycosyltransferase involved in cell wall biosynthesis